MFRKANVNQFYLVTPKTYQKLTSSSDLTEYEREILTLLRDKNLTNHQKLVILNNWLFQLTKREEFNEKSLTIKEDVDESITRENEVFQPSVFSSAKKKKECCNKTTIDEEKRTENTIDDESQMFIQNFSKNPEKNLKESSNNFSNFIPKNYFQNQPGTSKSTDVKNDVTEIDLSKELKSFVNNIKDAANRTISFRDLSVDKNKLLDDKSFVNLRNKLTNSIYTIPKSSGFLKRVRAKSKSENKNDRMKKKKLNFQTPMSTAKSENSKNLKEVWKNYENIMVMRSGREKKVL
ncbi:hypothetical protein PVAND_017627 [Polypedilum vanderplanki]|uniref:Uncharacterized protein n=1 Tax=Polypedilum vanderplanki TaxID=319348 RepID=A0A9J6B9D8_POLVA|nr:hypothetical protein PVAND_017627 [Polypedilum vanderplanki]